jgi:biuret amidohydrolase
MSATETITTPTTTARTPSSTGLVAGTTPYPWPYDAGLTRGRTALVVLGWNDAWWRLCDDPAAVLEPIILLAASVDCVITIDQPPPATHGPPGLAPADGTLPELAGAQVVRAVGVDGFFGGPLDTLLREDGRDLLLCVGLGLEAAVHSTMRSANDMGYECLLVIDACAPLVPELVPAAISMVEMSGGIFGAVGTTGPVLAALAAEPS